MFLKYVDKALMPQRNLEGLIERSRYFCLSRGEASPSRFNRAYFIYFILTVQHVNHHICRSNFARDARVIPAVIELSTRY